MKNILAVILMGLLFACGSETNNGFAPLFPQQTYILSDPESILNTCVMYPFYPSKITPYVESEEYFAHIELDGTHTISGEEINNERNGHFVLYTYDDREEFFMQIVVKPMEDYLHFGIGVRIEPNICIFAIHVTGLAE